MENGNTYINSLIDAQIKKNYPYEDFLSELGKLGKKETFFEEMPITTQDEFGAESEVFTDIFDYLGMSDSARDKYHKGQSGFRDFSKDVESLYAPDIALTPMITSKAFRNLLTSIPRKAWGKAFTNIKDAGIIETETVEHLLKTNPGQAIKAILKDKPIWKEETDVVMSKVKNFLDKNPKAGTQEISDFMVKSSVGSTKTRGQMAYQGRLDFRENFFWRFASEFPMRKRYGLPVRKYGELDPSDLYKWDKVKKQWEINRDSRLGEYLYQTDILNPARETLQEYGKTLIKNLPSKPMGEKRAISFVETIAKSLEGKLPNPSPAGITIPSKASKVYPGEVTPSDVSHLLGSFSVYPDIQKLQKGVLELNFRDLWDIGRNIKSNPALRELYTNKWSKSNLKTATESPRKQAAINTIRDIDELLTKYTSPTIGGNFPFKYKSGILDL